MSIIHLNIYFKCVCVWMRKLYNQIFVYTVMGLELDQQIVFDMCNFRESPRLHYNIYIFVIRFFSVAIRVMFSLIDMNMCITLKFCFMKLGDSWLNDLCDYMYGMVWC